MTRVRMEEREPSRMLRQAVLKLLTLINDPLEPLFWRPLLVLFRATSALGRWCRRYLDAVEQRRKFTVEIISSRNGPQHRIFDHTRMDLPIGDQIAIGVIGMVSCLEVEELLVEIVVNFR